MNTKLLNIVYILTLFVRSFDSLQGIGLRSSEVVRVVRRAMGDWPATPQGSKKTTKTGKNVKSENKNMKNKANLNSPKFTATSYSTKVYNALQPKTQNGTKPNKANLKPTPNTLNPHFFQEKPSFLLPLICKSKPNFENQEITASTCKRETYTNLHPQPTRKANPIQTQSAALISWRKPFQEPTPHHHERKMSIGHQTQFQNKTGARVFRSKAKNVAKNDKVAQNIVVVSTQIIISIIATANIKDKTMEEPTKKDMVDTTDSLEAVSAFKAMKNFLFLVLLISLIIQQAAFWINEANFVDQHKRDRVLSVSETITLLPAAKPKVDKEVKEAATAAVESIEDKAQTQSKEATAPEVKAPEPISVTTTEKKSRASKIIAKLRPTTNCIEQTVKLVNFTLIAAGTLYCLVLLICVKISLTGRLGGLRHISRAFLLSLFALVFMMPWQLAFDGAIAGSIFTPAELFCKSGIAPDNPVLDAYKIIMYYLRFVGLWLVVIVLLITAQFRSMRWTRATLKRLGIIH